MRFGPVSVTWLDQPPAGPAHAKMMREQRLTVQRLQGYVVAPVVIPAVPTPTVRDYEPLMIADLSCKENRGLRTDCADVIGSICGVLIGVLAIAAGTVSAVVVSGLLLFVLPTYVIYHWSQSGNAPASVSQPLSSLDQPPPAQGFINRQDHGQPPSMPPLDQPAVRIDGAQYICVATAPGQWLTVPTADAQSTLAVLNDPTANWHAKQGIVC